MVMSELTSLVDDDVEHLVTTSFDRCLDGVVVVRVHGLYVRVFLHKRSDSVVRTSGDSVMQ